MLKENGYQESIINKIFRRITNNHSLPQSQQLTQATDIQEEEISISINLLYFEGTSEKLRRILRSHTFNLMNLGMLLFMFFVVVKIRNTVCVVGQFGSYFIVSALIMYLLPRLRPLLVMIWLI